MGKRSLFLIVLTLFCLVEEIKAAGKFICQRDKSSDDVIIWCKADYIMYNPVQIDKIENAIKKSLEDKTLKDVVQL